MPANTRPWIVLVDETPESYHPTRDDARATAAWWRRHPAVKDRRAFHGSGKVRVVHAEAYTAELLEEQRANGW
jgi:hypothetical protein